MFSCEFCKIVKNIFSYRTLPVAVSEHDWFYKSSFWRLCLPRMFIYLNMNDNKRKIGLGKKRMVEVKECFICKTLSIKWFLNFLAGGRIICLKSVKFFKLQLNIFKWNCAFVLINLHPTNIFYIQIVPTGVRLNPRQSLTVNCIIKQ